MRFEYHDDFNGRDYDSYLKLRVKDCLCKHVCRNVSDKTNKLIKACENIGYNGVWWGYGENLYINPEVNRIVQISRIQCFIYDKFIHPIRLVIDFDGDIWVDNMHNTIANIFCKGDDITFKDMPVFIVDLRYDVPQIIDGYRLITFDYDKIQSLIETSYKRCYRSSSDVKAVGYTIREFMEDNDISRGALTLPSHTFYDEYARAVNDMIK